MREVGGWPEVYSKGVAHCEETDGTHKLYLAGYKLLIDPRATGNHLRVGGGIRSTRNVKQVQAADLLKWESRLEQLKQIKPNPTVAVACPNHQYGIGGGQKLFYQTVHRLQEDTNLVVHAWFGDRMHFDPDQCAAAFGFTYKQYELLEQYDVGIVIGHDINNDLPARHKIHYGMFPIDVNSEKLRDFDAFLAISEYSKHYTEQFWRVKTNVLYPPVEDIGCGDTPKENIILIVSRCVPSKAPIWLMQQFIKMNLPEYTMHVVSSSSVEDFDDYYQQARQYAQGHPTIVWHENISKKELDSLYRRAKVLWSANGMMSEVPRACEHFGYTPVEAWSAGCVPVVYDKGGHQETVDELFRWSTEDQLRDKTLVAFQYLKSADYMCLRNVTEDHAPVHLERFNNDFSEELENWIRRVNGLAIQHERLEALRAEGKIKVVMLSDGPYMPELGIGVTSGFGVVAGQIVKRMLDCDDIELHYFGMEDRSYIRHDIALPFNYYPARDDPEAIKTFPEFVLTYKPDVIFIIYSSGDAITRIKQIRNMQIKTPIVIYFPVEGAHRVNASVPELLTLVDYPVTYCRNGSDLIEKNTGVRIPWAYHGADHADFGPLDPEVRQHIRELLGWEDKYCIGFFGTNKRVKNQPVLIRAMKILLERGMDDVILYLHTKEFDSHVLQGWHLGNMLDVETTEDLPLADHVWFPIQNDKWHGVPFDQTGIETWKLTTPPTKEGRCMLLSSLPLVTRYGLLDLYFDVSSAEGWGLPTLEAAACGVPTITVDDTMARSEVHAKYCWKLQPISWDTWHIGTDLALLAADEVASSIELSRMKGELPVSKWEDNLTRIMRELPWEPTARYFIDLIREASKR